MRWTVRGAQRVYDSAWLGVDVADIEVPGGTRLEARVVRFPVAAVGTVLVRPADGNVLLLWRHRWTTDSWGWEIPAGRVETGEDPRQAAMRETQEETGWRTEGLAPLVRYHPANGSTDLTFLLFRGTAADWSGPPGDDDESSGQEWLSESDVRDAVRRGDITGGMTLTALLHHFGDWPTPRS